MTAAQPDPSAAAEVPEQAVTDDRARAAIADAYQHLHDLIVGAYDAGRLSEGLVDQLAHASRVLTATAIDAVARLEAAVPAIREAERQRLANRAAMLDEVRAELDDAFQFTQPGGSRHGYVTRAWVEALLATQAASAAEAELVKLTRADTAIAERERWLAVLADHYLAGIECDPERKLDNPVCGCSRVFLGWHPSIGEARQAWIDHVAGLASELVIRDDPYVTGLRDGAADLRARVAGLEALAADILTRYLDAIGTDRPDDVADEIEQWEAALKGGDS